MTRIAFVLLCIAVICLAAPTRSRSAWAALCFAAAAAIVSLWGLRW